MDLATATTGGGALFNVLRSSNGTREDFCWGHAIYYLQSTRTAAEATSTPGGTRFGELAPVDNADASNAKQLACIAFPLRSDSGSCSIFKRLQSSCHAQTE